MPDELREHQGRVVTTRRSFSDAEKDFIVADIHSRMTRWFRSDPIDKACLFWARLTCEYLNEHYAVGARLQAGTMMWPFNATDDGVTATHFSYVWEPDHPRSCAALEQGRLPEMHAWVAIPASGEIIDLTTRYFVSCAAEAGFTWTASEPPKFLWTHVSTLPPGVVYRPDRIATLFAGARLVSAG